MTFFSLYVSILVVFVNLTLSTGFVSPLPTTRKQSCYRTDISMLGLQEKQEQQVVFSDSSGIEEQKEELKSRLPPLDRSKCTKLELEFRELLEDILYTDSEMECVTHPRLRSIFEGVAASYHEPAVYRAFEVLYEDYMPLRVAGRVVHNKLQNVMEESKAYRQSQVDETLTRTNLSVDVVDACWPSFVNLAQDNEISLEKAKFLVGEGYANGLWKQMKNVDEYVENIEGGGGRHSKTTLTFSELLDFLSTTEPPTSAKHLQELLKVNPDLDEHSYHHHHNFEPTRLDKRRQKYRQRYDHMLEKFGEWKDFIPDGEGRRLDILRGCFVGSENPQVVEALRVIYTDYSALRLSGDWIFNVVSTIMNVAMSRRHHHHHQSTERH